MNNKQKYCIKTCKGRCCQEVYIGKSPRELTQMKNSALDKIKKKEYTSHQYDYDCIEMWKMLNFVQSYHRDKEKYYWYSCTNLKDGKCQIYDHRPSMCRTFGEIDKFGNTKASEHYKDFCIYHPNFKGENHDTNMP